MRKGFTLIELLLVVVIIGIIAALVLPRFGDVRERAYVSAMQSDLRNLATAQELYQIDNAAYASTVGDLPNFVESEGVSINLTSVDASGYFATAQHPNAGGVECTLNAISGHANQGVLACS